jgi:enoyl-[acyl-carrier protein] reductase I
MGLMTGKRGLIMGLANDKSIAWGIAKAWPTKARSWRFPTRANSF